MKQWYRMAVIATLMAGQMQAHADDVKAQCIECHGENGIATSSGYPHLAGQQNEYLLKQLRDFREGRRSSPFMNIVAANLAPEDVAVMAHYFASQPAPGVRTLPDAAARKLYEQSCASCHGASAAGAGQIPALRGQQMFYLRDQLINFRAGQRNNSPERVMNKVADALSDAEIDALARYLSNN